MRSESIDSGVTLVVQDNIFEKHFQSERIAHFVNAAFFFKFFQQERAQQKNSVVVLGV